MFDDVTAQDQIVTAQAVQGLKGVAYVNFIIRQRPERVPVRLVNLDAVDSNGPALGLYSLLIDFEYFAAQETPFTESNADIQNAVRTCLLYDV